MIDRRSTDESTELELRAEVEELRQRLARAQSHAQTAGATHGPGHAPAHGHVVPVRKRPSATLLWSLLLLAAVVGTAAFFGGYLPHMKNQNMLADLVKEQETDIPPVNVTVVHRSPASSTLVLPGNIQAITEAPILARASGYISQRYVDIGDRVKQGQLLAEIDSPELGQQVAQARANVQQLTLAADSAQASLEQGRANEQLNKVTAERYTNLVERGAVSRQDADNFRLQYDAQRANVAALDKAYQAAKGSIAGANANLNRLLEVQSYTKVKAPFDGIVTVRNVDTGALVNEANTLLYRIAQIDRLRIYVNLAQSDSNVVRQGMAATIRIPDLAREFKGVVSRTSNSLDPNTRTMLAEVQVPNPEGLLLPGMYALVNFETPRISPPLLIKGDALVIRTEGPRVAVITPQQTVHFKEVTLGRDLGDTIEILSGLEAGQQIVVNPGDTVVEGAKVKPMLIDEADGKKGSGGSK
jgi:RND family efflux transporter MFP subunit